MSFLSKIFGDANEKYLKEARKIVQKINSLEDGLLKLSDGELKTKTEEFEKRFLGSESLDEILPEAFAVVRETAKRTLGQRHFD